MSDTGVLTTQIDSNVRVDAASRYGKFLVPTSDWCTKMALADSRSENGRKAAV